MAKPGPVARYAAAVAASSADRIVGAEQFIIVGPLGRCGTTLLVSLLDAHPRIRCEGEIVAHRPLPFALDRYLRGRGVLARSRGARAHGVKLLATHTGFDGVPGDPVDFFRGQRARGAKFIVVRRRNLLAQALSFIRAERVGRWHDRTGDQVFEPMEVDPEEIVAYLHALEWMSRWVEECLEEEADLALTYEDDLLTPDAQQRSVDRIAQLLGVNASPVAAGTKKIAPPSLRDVVSNYDELASLLGVTRYAWMLDEGPTSSQLTR